MGAWQQNTHGIFQHNCKQTAIVMEKSSKPHELIHLIVPFTSAMMEENHSKVVDTWDKYLCTQSTPSYILECSWTQQVNHVLASYDLCTSGASLILAVCQLSTSAAISLVVCRSSLEYWVFVQQSSSRLWINTGLLYDNLQATTIQTKMIPCVQEQLTKTSILIYLQIQKMIPLIDVFQNAIMVRQKWLVWTA